MLELILQIISIALRNDIKIIILNESVRASLKDLFKVQRANVFTLISSGSSPQWEKYLARLEVRSTESKAELLFVIKGTHKNIIDW